MNTKSSRVSFLSTSIFIIFLLTFGQAAQFKSYPVVTEYRLKLTKEYCESHYGLDSYELKNPKMVVIHYTAVSGIKTVHKIFSPETITPERKYLKKYGEVNVGVHFVVDKNGDVYTLLPEDIIGRHTIGFNHVSIGIENVACNQKELTEQQLAVNAELVSYLVRRYPAIRYLIGHFEYMNERLPHFVLFKELDKNYRPTAKKDPGRKFMKDLRRLMKEKYNIVLKD